MKSREKALLIVGLLLIGATAGGLVYLKSNQRLGKPGVKTAAIEGSPRLQIELPLQVEGYAAEAVPVDPKTLEALPADTSMVQARYRELPNGPEIQTFVVLMGTDRTSIHNPQFCLTGAGWGIDGASSRSERVTMASPAGVELPVMKLIARRKVEIEGRPVDYSGVFVYWLLADGVVTSERKVMMQSMAKHLLRTGELQRWAYVAYFAPCPPGAEDETFQRIQKLMNATVPQYQLAWP